MWSNRFQLLASPERPDDTQTNLWETSDIFDNNLDNVFDDIFDEDTDTGIIDTTELEYRYPLSSFDVVSFDVVSFDVVSFDVVSCEGCGMMYTSSIPLTVQYIPPYCCESCRFGILYYGSFKEYTQKADRNIDISVASSVDVEVAIDVDVERARYVDGTSFLRNVNLTTICRGVS